MKTSSVTSVAVVGAGPYGISIAAHLRSADVDFRIFGRPMHRWREQMPKGMFLKSEGFASNLSDPDNRHTLAQYCAAAGVPYGETGKPVPLDVFTRYATAFQQQLVPDVEEVMVQHIERTGDWFDLQLTSGERLRARKVVLATGLEHAAHVPPELEQLPSDRLSHVSAHHDLSGFKGKDITVIGGGQSALETAALLTEQGAAARLVVRASAVAWNSLPKDGPRSFYQRLRTPSSGLGSGLQLWAYCTVPGMFRYLPGSARFERFKNVLGPAGAWWLKERVVGRLPVLTDHVIVSAEARDGRVTLRLARRDGHTLDVETEHVIAATGYRFAVERLPFLSAGLKSRVRTVGQAPVLSSDFESSVPGLYFTGMASGIYFGPVMRFLVGADHSARRICRHLATLQRRNESLHGMGLKKTNRAQVQGASQVG
jgi:FAD-dependent urate hydroxylase